MIKDEIKEFDNILKRSEDEARKQDERDKEDRESYTKLSNAPMSVQDSIRNADKSTTTKREDWSSFINAMDKIGGYMSGFAASIGQDRQLDELKKQTTKLNEIAVNTKNNSTARYN